MVVLSFTNPLSCIKVENGYFYPIKEAPTLKPRSLRLGTCQGQNSILRQKLSNVCGITWEAVSFSLNLPDGVWVISLANKGEGSKTNTPPKTNTYKRLPIANTLLPWIVPHDVGVLQPTKWHLKVPLVVPCHTSLHYLHVRYVTDSTPSRVGSRWDLAILFTGGMVQVHKAKEVNSGYKGVSSRMQGGQYPRCKGTVLQPNSVGSWR